jgi:restriction endonuclease S subunit
MSNDALTAQVRLADIADIRPGYPFRGAVTNRPDGEVAVVQIKNVDPDAGIDWSGLVRTELTGRRKPDWLREGDVLFTARGNRNAAAPVDEITIKAVSAPHLFVVRVTAPDHVLPAFLAWLMNQADAQRYFAQEATGSYITSIRKQALLEMPLRLPSLEKQRLVVELDRAARQERQILEKLIENRKQQISLVAQTLMQ